MDKIRPFTYDVTLPGGFLSQCNNHVIRKLSDKVLRPGRVLYVPPRWAHRSVNTGTDTDLVTFYVFPGHAGHDYGSIQERGFRKQVIESDGRPKVVDNPKWAAG